MAEEQELKVVDRRSQSEGNNVQPKNSAGDVQAKKTAEAQQARSTPNESEMPPMDFSSFIVGLATQAMMLLGEIPEPQSGQLLPTNLPAARQTIDIISLLQEKTAGNLSEDESKLVQDVLTSLRIGFVKKAK